MKRVSYRKEDRKVEIALVLPHPDLPLQLAVPDGLPGGPGGDVLDRQCPGQQCPGPEAHKIHTPSNASRNPSSDSLDADSSG